MKEFRHRLTFLPGESATGRYSPVHETVIILISKGEDTCAIMRVRSLPRSIKQDLGEGLREDLTSKQDYDN